MSAIRRASVLFRVVLIMMACNPVFAASDDELIEALASASEYAEVQAAMEAINERLSTGEPPQRFLDDLVRVSTTNREVANRSMDGVLQLVREQGPYSEQALLYMAEALGSGLEIYGYRSLSKILTSDEVQPVPDAVFDALIQNLTSSSVNLTAEVFVTLSLSESRLARVGEGFRQTWERDDLARHQKDRVIKNLASIYDAEPIPTATIDSLFELAMTEPHLSSRVAALEVISKRSLDAARSDELGRSISAYFLQPGPRTADTQQINYGERIDLQRQMAFAFLALFDAPYPDYVVDLWLREISPYQDEMRLAAMQRIVSARALTDEQFTALIAIVNKGPNYAQPQHPLLSLKLAPLSDDALQQAIDDFQPSYDDSRRVEAGYRLLYHYGANGVPTPIADVAATYLRGRPGNKFLPVSLYLVSNAASDEAKYTKRLIDAASGYADSFSDFKMYLGVFADRNTDSLVLQYAGDESQPERFRSDVISMAGMHLDDGEPLNPEVADLLDDIARNADATILVQSAGHVLKAHGAGTPIRVTLTNRDFQSSVLSLVFLAMLVINAIALFVGSASAMVRIDGSSKGVAGRVILWAVLSVGMFVALVIGFVGFIGHNSAPAPSTSLALNIPAYIGTVIYVSLAWRWMRRASAARTITQD